MPKKYDGAYTKGAIAGSSNNTRGKAAEVILEEVLQKKGLIKNTDYFCQQRVPYLSEESFRKVSSCYAFFRDPITDHIIDSEALSKKLTDFLFSMGGPNIQEDFVICNGGNDNSVNTIISVTQANPTKPGHSIENKLHQALGELYLHKIHNPKCRSLIFIGGEKKGWATEKQFRQYGCSYVLKVMELFFDDVVYAWDENLENRIAEALTCKLRNVSFWNAEKERANNIILDSDIHNVPCDNLRSEFNKYILNTLLKEDIKTIDDISNGVVKFMATCSSNARGVSKNAFLNKILEKNIIGIETDRGFNNPSEAAIALLLKHGGVKYHSEIEHGKANVKVSNNLLYDMGFKDMHRYTDFILETSGGTGVYIESKSAGGGFEGGHKHITDRAREQIARSLLHRSKLINNELTSTTEDYEWVFVLDADWCTPEIYPTKFIHVLQLAGATKWFSAKSLVDSDYNVNTSCEFIRYIKANCKGC